MHCPSPACRAVCSRAAPLCLLPSSSALCFLLHQTWSERPQRQVQKQMLLNWALCVLCASYHSLQGVNLSHPGSEKKVSQCWQAPRYFWNHAATHSLEWLDTTTGEAFWKAISLAHSFGLTAWKVHCKTQSDFNERRSRSALENLMRCLCILSLIPCDPQRKRNNSESPQGRQGSLFYCPPRAFKESVESYSIRAWLML